MKEKIDVGKPDANIMIKVTVLREEFMKFAELTLVDPPEHGPRPLNELKALVEGIEFARMYIAGNWVRTNKCYISKQDPIPGLWQINATLEIDAASAAQLHQLRKAVFVDKNGTTQDCVGVEIEFNHSHRPEYIKYKSDYYFFRDVAIDARIDSILESGQEADETPESAG